MLQTVETGGPKMPRFLCNHATFEPKNCPFRLKSATLDLIIHQLPQQRHSPFGKVLQWLEGYYSGRGIDLKVLV